MTGARRAAKSGQRGIPRHGHTKPAQRQIQHRRSFGLPLRLALGVAGALTGVVVWAVAARSMTPRANTPRTQFDAILVLGTPADSDGNPTPELLERVTEGVREYRRGVAPHIVVSGAAAHNQFVEAEVMARIAQAQGVPASVIVEEPRALDTIQNVCYTARILQAHGWRSVEVISSASHLPRAALILTHWAHENGDAKPLEWRVRSAQDNLTPGYYSKVADLVEILKTARYLAWAQWTESCPA